MLSTHKKSNIVVRYIQGAYCLAHAETYQNAFSNKINKFNSFEEARNFALKNNCDVLNTELSFNCLNRMLGIGF